MNSTDIDNIDIKNVVILDTDQAGDVYMEKLFPLWVDAVVMTLEGKYPLDSSLKARVLDKMQNDKNLKVILYGANAVKTETLSQHRINMFNLFNLDLRRYPWQQPVINFDEFKIIELCRAFCDIGDIERLQNYNSYLDVMMPESVNWYHNLLRS